MAAGFTCSVAGLNRCPVCLRSNQPTLKNQSLEWMIQRCTIAFARSNANKFPQTHLTFFLPTFSSRPFPLALWNAYLRILVLHITVDTYLFMASSLAALMKNKTHVQFEYARMWISESQRKGKQRKGVRNQWCTTESFSFLFVYKDQLTKRVQNLMNVVRARISDASDFHVQIENTPICQFMQMRIQSSKLTSDKQNTHIQPACS